MNKVELNIYCIATQVDGQFIRYNLPFVAIGDAYAKQMVYASVKDAIGKDTFDQFSLYHVGYFVPDDKVCCVDSIPACFICSVNDVIAEFVKETKDE